MIKDKKAEMTSKQLITVILLITGFVILLFVFYRFNFEGSTDREVCHTSVVMRGSLPETFDIKKIPDLKCKTRKVCITDKIFGKGDCEEELGKKYDSIRISKNKEKQEEEIKEFIAQELADCWSMMGEGKIQIFTREWSSTKRCSICSRISFDKSLKEEIKEIDKLGDYLISNNIPNKDISYWKFLYPGLGFEGYQLDDKYSTEQKAIIFIELDKTKAPDWICSIIGSLDIGGIGAKTGAVLGSFIPGGGTVVGGVVGFVGGAVIGGIGGKYLGKTIEKNLITEKFGEYEFVTGHLFMDYDITKIKNLECDSLENIP